MAMCMGSFCGKFHDELQGSSDDEDEEEERKKGSDNHMRGEGVKAKGFMAFLFRKKSKKGDSTREAETGGSEGASSSYRWTRGGFLSPITVRIKNAKGGQESTEQRLRLQVISYTAITPGMMNCIYNIGGLHTIEMIRCDREEIPPSLADSDGLAVLRMSHNRLTKFSEDFAKIPKIEIIQLDWNSISEFAPGIFGTGQGKAFTNLEVLNLAHNRLSILPHDFGQTGGNPLPSGNAIKYIDLSYNSIGVLPENCTKYCTNLEVLNLSHNCLEKLPDSFALTKLQRLFVSFNELKSLPDDIGKCKNLCKVRIIANQITELPESMLNLWKEKGGKLEEFLPDKNPMVMPSITTFVMAETNTEGINQAFKLFESFHNDRRERKAQEERKALERKQELMALEVPEGDVAKGHLAVEDQLPSADSSQHALAINDGPDALHAQAPSHSQGVGSDFYYAHCNGDHHRITEIRHAESTLMLVKKQLYVSRLWQLAQDEKKKVDAKNREDALANNGEAIHQLPENLKQFVADPDPTRYEVSSFKDKVSVTDVDLYFNLLVTATRPMFSNCSLLFNKFENSGKGYMSEEEWIDLCDTIPVELAPDIVNQMWQLLSWRTQKGIEQRDFIAAWHIHDVEHRDPWIGRVAEVLRMDYYDMAPEELQRRLRAKDSADATPDLDFDTKLGEKTFHDQLREWGPVVKDYRTQDLLENTEGLRTIAYSPMEEAVDAIEGDHFHRERKEKFQSLRDKVSLATTEMSDYEAMLKQDTYVDDDDDAASLSSRNLSGDSGEEESDFDATVFLAQRRDLLTQEQQAKYGAPIVVNSDEALRQLMDIPASEFFKRSELASADTEASGHAKGSAQNPVSRPRRRGGAGSDRKVIDPKMKTDVFAVRQAIRRVYRNMPYYDFVKLINFTLRGMQLIKHSPAEVNTFWHADDPTFKHTMGIQETNQYTRNLMEQMGFVRLRCKGLLYWVWPDKHLVAQDSKEKEVPTWGRKEIPVHCPGKDPHRLDDMIFLLQSCQRSLHKEKGKFTGHFKAMTS